MKFLLTSALIGLSFSQFTFASTNCLEKGKEEALSMANAISSIPGHSNSRDFKFTQIPLNQVGVLAGKNMFVLTFKETVDLSEISREGVMESDMSVFVAMDDQCKILESVARRLENI
jgi:hypothetical protein